ncbi:MAG: amidohydrolase family protein [Armatimonadota bacterium]|nr:amidohydrolase family protein [Armatimonadota bacterium]
MAIIDLRTQMGTSRVWAAQSGSADLLKAMSKYGVGGCVVSSTLANTCDFRTGNGWIKQEIAKQSRFLGCVVANASHVEESVEDMHQYLPEKNFTGLLVRSGIPGRHVTLDECSEILNAFRRFNKVVFLEAGNREAVAAAAEIARKFNLTRFIMLSMGGDDWMNAVAAAEKTVNLYLETSGNLNPNKINYAFERVGPNRLLFGSNWPYADPALTIGLVEDADISAGDKKRIFETNAMRLLGFEKGQ